MVAKPKPQKSPVAKSATKRAGPAALSKNLRVAVAPVEKSAAPLAIKVTPMQADQSSVGAGPAQQNGGRPKSGSAANSAPALKIKDLIEIVASKTGAKKTDARAIVEATLAALGDALSKGDTLNLPPLGRAKVSRTADAGSGKAMTVKLRRPSAAGPGRSGQKPALADIDD